VEDRQDCDCDRHHDVGHGPFDMIDEIDMNGLAHPNDCAEPHGTHHEPVQTFRLLLNFCSGAVLAQTTAHNGPLRLLCTDSSSSPYDLVAAHAWCKIASSLLVSLL